LALKSGIIEQVLSLGGGQDVFKLDIEGKHNHFQYLNSLLERNVASL